MISDDRSQAYTGIPIQIKAKMEYDNKKALFLRQKEPPIATILSSSSQLNIKWKQEQITERDEWVSI